MNLRSEAGAYDAAREYKVIESHVENGRARFLFMVQIAHIFTSALLNGDSVYRNGLTPHTMIGFAIMAVVGFLMFYKKLKISFWFAAHTTGICCALAISLVSFFFWYITVSYAALLTLIPLSMMILLGQRAAVTWLLICIILVVLFEQLNPVLRHLITYKVEEKVPQALNLVLLMAISTLMIFLASSSAKLVFKDLVHEKRRLEQTQKELMESQKFKNRFFSSVSHEIRTPMNAINGIAELMRGSHNLDEHERKLIDTLNHSAKHLLNIINDLLDIGKLEEGKLQVHYSDFSIRQVLNESVDIVRGAAIEKGLELVLDVDEDVPLYLYSDPLRLRQCLVNLLSNAVKFTRHGSVRLLCDVSLNPPLPILRCTVQDTGQGIEVQLQDRIFGSYVQGQQNSDPLVGTGLGLHITKSLVDLLGGEIGFQSKVGKGSSFYITLPIVPRLEVHLTAQVVKEWPASSAAQPPLHLLIVDDNATNTHIAEKLLQRHIPSAVMDTATNGREALEWVEQQAAGGRAPSLILMDVHMPVMDGLEATRHIRSHRNPLIAKIPIMALTANAAPEDLQACVDAGMNDAIAKPFEISQLLIKIAKQTAKS